VPTAVIVNQSVGDDAAKKIKGRKRFTLVDTLGLLVGVKVVAASVPERQGAQHLLQHVDAERDRLPRLVRVGVDYERLPESLEALIYIAMIRIMLRRLA